MNNKNWLLVQSKKPLANAILLAVGLTGYQLPSFAQGAALEEVVVTARKRDESLQETPISMTAFGGEALKSLGVTNVKDMEGVVPGLNLGGGGNGAKGDSNPFIRGVGQRETKVTIDSAVGTYIDGVFIGRSAGALLDTIDVESMQVLRGPQGTLFGKNVTGGAIVITTKKPSPEFGGHVDATVGNYGQRNGAMAVNGTLIEDKVYGRLTVASVKNDGFFENLSASSGGDWGDADRISGVGQLRWDASDDVLVDLLWSAGKTRQTPRPMRCNYLADDIGYDVSGNRFVTSVNTSLDLQGKPNLKETCEAQEQLDPSEFNSELGADDGIFPKGVYEVDTQTASATVSWSVGDIGFLESVDFKSITAYRSTEQSASEDLDGHGISFLGRVQPESNLTEQYSQEFQFTSMALDSRLTMTGGLYFFNEKTHQDQLQSYGGVISTPIAGGDDKLNVSTSTQTKRETDNKAAAAYFQGSFSVNEQIEITAGIRYTWEERSTIFSEAYIYPNSTSSTDSAANALIPSPSNGLPLAWFYGGNLQPFDQWAYGADCNGDTNGDGIWDAAAGDEFAINASDVGASCSEKGTRSDSAWTPMISIKYLASDELLDTLSLDSGMIFFTFSEGFRAGGVVAGVEDDNITYWKENGGGVPGDAICAYCDSNIAAETKEFEPEHVNNYELGIKLEGFDRRLRGNFAVFYTDYTDIQVTSIVDNNGIPVPFIVNAGEATIQGVEAEFNVVPTENWRITSSVAYTDGGYDEFIVDGSELGTAIKDLDRSDEPMPRIADWTAFLAVDYFWFTDNWGMISPSVNFRYSSEIYHGFDRDSFLAEDQHTSDEILFVGARLSWQLPDDRTSVTLWGKNLTNEDDYLVGGVPLVSVAGSTSMIYADPKTYGLDISYRFGD